jgi:hypothetical protein
MRALAGLLLPVPFPHDDGTEEEEALMVDRAGEDRAGAPRLMEAILSTRIAFATASLRFRSIKSVSFSSAEVVEYDAGEEIEGRPLLVEDTGFSDDEDDEGRRDEMLSVAVPVPFMPRKIGEP